jgi:DNA-directed RNA polymerase subunit K/omega
MSDSEYSDNSSVSSSNSDNVSEISDDDNLNLNLSNKFPSITPGNQPVDLVESDVDDEDDDDDYYDDDGFQIGGEDGDNSDDEQDDEQADGKENAKKKLIQLPSDNYNDGDDKDGDDKDGDDDDDDDYDNNYLQKFDAEITKNYVREFHPECLHRNYDEVSKLIHILKDSDNIVVDPLHKTVPFITKYEITRILGQRAKQIQYGSKPFISIPENIIDENVIAELELKAKKIPFILGRPIPGGGFEYWKVSDLEQL